MICELDVKNMNSSFQENQENRLNNLNLMTFSGTTPKILHRSPTKKEMLKDQQSIFRSKRSSTFSLTLHKRKNTQDQCQSTGEKKNQIDSDGPSNETMITDEGSTLKTIAKISEEQNKNLKEHNQFLLQKIRKMQEREKKFKETLKQAKKYKQLYEKTKIQLAIAKEECEANKMAAKQMKIIAERGILQLEAGLASYYDESDEEDSLTFHPQKR